MDAGQAKLKHDYIQKNNIKVPPRIAAPHKMQQDFLGFVNSYRILYSCIGFISL